MVVSLTHKSNLIDQCKQFLAFDLIYTDLVGRRVKFTTSGQFSDGCWLFQNMYFPKVFGNHPNLFAFIVLLSSESKFNPSSTIRSLKLHYGTPALTKKRITKRTESIFNIMVLSDTE